jgi:HK97 gp10 family phage protein
VAVTVSGLREFSMNLKRLGVEAQDLKEVFAEIAKEVEQDAKAFAPVRTGNLRNRIRGSKYAQNRARITVSYTRYHRYVHFGARTVPRPTPFMFKAMDANVNTVEQRLVQGINELTDRVF